MHVLPLLLMALLGGQQVLDDFHYADTAAARAIWTADEGSPPVEVVREQDRSVLRLSAPLPRSRSCSARLPIAASISISVHREDSCWRPPSTTPRWSAD